MKEKERIIYFSTKNDKNNLTEWDLVYSSFLSLNFYCHFNALKCPSYCRRIDGFCINHICIKHFGIQLRHAIKIKKYLYYEFKVTFTVYDGSNNSAEY